MLPIRIVIRLPNWLGDTLLARPLLHRLRRGLAGAECVAVGPAKLLELLAGEMTFDRGEVWPAATRERRDLARRIRAWGADAIVVLPPSFSSALWAWQTGARTRIGYRHEWRRPLLTIAPPRPQRGDMHLAAEYVALGESLLGSPPDPAGSLEDMPALVPHERGLAAAARLLATRGLDASRLAILGPGAVYGPAKRWPHDRYAALGRRLVAHGYAVLVCGAASEQATCETVAQAIGAAAHSLAGETDLDCQAALCARAEVAVCNDSGLAHLSAAVGTRTVAVFGSTSSAWTAPIGPSVAIVQDAPVCSPCFQRTCRIGTLCLDAVTVAAVERACIAHSGGAAA